MFLHPEISRELAHYRQREMLAHAQHRRLARRLHAGPRTARRLGGALRAAVGLRTVPQT